MKNILSVALMAFMLPSCISGTPDCSDVDHQTLKSKLLRSKSDDLFQERQKLADSLRSYWIAQGYQESSFFESETKVDKVKNDSLAQLWEESTALLDSMWALAKDENSQAISSITFSDDVQLVTEGENSSLSAFYCTCVIQYETKDEAGEIEYKLTRKDYDSRTYHDVTHYSPKSKPLQTEEVWTVLLR